MHGLTPAHLRSLARAFTLIELLIVVAIISILASIAVPNFLEAQTRAKVARVKNDMRALAVAIESYRLDNTDYPMRRNTSPGLYLKEVPEKDKRLPQMKVMTTPQAYLTTLPIDIFEINIEPPNNLIDYYDSVQTAMMINSRFSYFTYLHVDPDTAGWMLVSVGPDSYLGNITPAWGWPMPGGMDAMVYRGTMYYVYDPTNGATSMGNIYSGQIGGMDQTSLRLTQLLDPGRANR
jgi:type II secretion system protein G